jgi:hypothetical protein
MGVNCTLRDRKEVGDDLLYLGVALLDDVMLVTCVVGRVVA